LLGREQLSPGSRIVPGIHICEIEGAQRFDLVFDWARCPVTVHYVRWHQPKRARTDAEVCPA